MCLGHWAPDQGGVGGVSGVKVTGRLDHQFRGSWGSDVLASPVPGRQSLWPGFLTRHFGSTAWAETLIMCGISTSVRDVFTQLEELNYHSSIALREWAGESLVERRAELKSRYKDLKREIDGRQGARGQAKGREATVAAHGVVGRGVAT